MKNVLYKNLFFGYKEYISVLADRLPNADDVELGEETFLCVNCIRWL